MSYKARNLTMDKHIFLGRKGGVSSGKYESLNVSSVSDDAKENVVKNLEIAAAQIGGRAENFARLIQREHTNKALFIEEPSFEKFVGDGMVCLNPDIILAISTADCVPVLFEDCKNKVVGAAHAGWKGALTGVLENTLELMLKKGAVLSDIAAAIGPCIGKKSYEVSKDFFESFIKENDDYAKFFASGKDAQHFMFDIEGLVKFRLEKAGLKNVSASGIDTYTNEDEYFSFRRYTHKGLIGSPKDFPVQFSLIKL